MMAKKSLMGVLLASAVAFSACAPVVNTRGNLVDNERLGNLTPGISQKADVQAVLGTPTTTSPFDDNTWYYIGEITENIAFYEHDVTERRVLAIRFDENGTLRDIGEADETDAQDIETVDAKTPTAGKEVNAFQQIIGNLGKFNTERAANTGTGAP